MHGSGNSFLSYVVAALAKVEMRKGAGRLAVTEEKNVRDVPGRMSGMLLAIQ